MAFAVQSKTVLAQRPALSLKVNLMSFTGFDVTLSKPPLAESPINSLNI